ncbi:class I SAM-dependent methyltransferase [Amphiplicatus metriothermophilus]|nr:class I SAM-dependent methyltransferase [Amphiplicatus metriothermophilus]MBB5517439.1 ubiquinone/menaquinone biosynthesis C-methylase UbiE [Amphiplicatus metriothermophilus]
MNEHGNGRKDYTPALGAHWLTPFYDFAIAAFTREGVWRGALVDLVDPQPDDRILDVGCGTGSLAVRLGRVADVVGVDPDPAVLARARAKAAKSRARARFAQGFLRAGLLPEGWRPTKAVSSLVLHQTPLEEKRRIIGEIHALLAPGGVFCLADYGRQPDRAQRFLFRALVQSVDGVENTEPNAQGVIETLLAEAGFAPSTPARVVRTPTGAVSLWRAVRQ